MDSDHTTIGHVIVKATITHTITYFLVGFLAFNLFSYSEQFADGVLGCLMRPTTHPLVQAGVLFQPIRGILFGIVFYLLRHSLFRKKGWLIMWITLVVIGIISTFGPTPGSIEGMIYTNLPIVGIWGGMLEVFVQSFLLSVISYYWITHPSKRWVTVMLGVIFALTIILPVLGLIARQVM